MFLRNPRQHVLQTSDDIMKHYEYTQYDQSSMKRPEYQQVDKFFKIFQLMFEG